MLAGIEYRWWWLLQDFFHLGGGVVLLTTAVGLLCTVTSKFQAVNPLTVQLLLESSAACVKQPQGSSPWAVWRQGTSARTERVGS